MILAGRMVGKQIGNYRVISPAVPWPIADVYLALDARKGGVVDIIPLPPDAAASLGGADRFLSETRALLGFGHPGFVRVLDCDRLDDGSVYLVSEHVEGECLSERLRRGSGLAYDLAMAREIVVQTAAAIGAAHEAGLLYLCLRPEHVLLVPASPGGGRFTVRLLALGLGSHFLSRIRQMAPGRELPASLLLYSSPEQCRGDGINPRSDVYALGCVLFETLVGQPPFRETDLWGLVSAHAHGSPPRIRELRPELPSALDDLVATMLEKDPARRPFCMGEIIAVLQATLPELLSIDAATAPPSSGVARTALLEPDASANAPPPAPIAKTAILEPEPPVARPAADLTSTPTFRPTRLLTPREGTSAPMPPADVASPHRVPRDESLASAETAALRRRPTPPPRRRSVNLEVQRSSHARILVVVTLACVALAVGLLLCFRPQASKRARVPIEQTPASQPAISPPAVPSPAAIDMASPVAPATPPPELRPSQPEPGATRQPPSNLGKNLAPSRRTKSPGPAGSRPPPLDDAVIEPTFMKRR
jgi:serine/threonine-protein kinase